MPFALTTAGVVGVAMGATGAIIESDDRFTTGPWPKITSLPCRIKRGAGTGRLPTVAGVVGVAMGATGAIAEFGDGFTGPWPKTGTPGPIRPTRMAEGAFLRPG